MKILYITSLAFRKSSSASIRNIGLINGFIDNDDDIDLLTIGYPESVEDKFLKNIISSKVNIYSTNLNYLNKYLNNFVIDKKNESVKNTLFKKIKEAIKSIIFFPDVDKGWINNFDENVLKNHYDLIISSSDSKTSHFIAKKIIAHLKYSKWVQIWGDPWVEDLNKINSNVWREKFFEKQLLRLATRVFYVSEPTSKLIQKKYPEFDRKISHVGRSYLVETIGREVGDQSEWIFTYTGSLNSNRNISTFIKAISEYNFKSAKKIRLNIYGKLDDEAKKIIENYSCVDYQGSLDFNDVLTVYANSDVLVYVDNGGGSTQIPGKLYDYFGTDRPIYALVDQLDDPTSQFLIQTERCTVQLNKTEFINFGFLEGLKAERIMEEYSGTSIAKTIKKAMHE